ncbi:zinc carboxypeptidase [Trypanosoma cruzi]|nr:zinc carboxypeptidase [Trypanosoma cruzi]
MSPAHPKRGSMNVNDDDDDDGRFVLEEKGEENGGRGELSIAGCFFAAVDDDDDGSFDVRGICTLHLCLCVGTFLLFFFFLVFSFVVFLLAFLSLIAFAFWAFVRLRQIYLFFVPLFLHSKFQRFGFFPSFIIIVCVCLLFWRRWP